VSIGSFLLRRLGLGAITILGVSLLVFLFLHIIPGDPIDNLAGDQATPEQREKLAECMGLRENHADVSMPRQFVGFLGHLVDGTLGHQCPEPPDHQSVAGRIGQVFPYTVELAVASMVLALVLGLPLGVLAAVKRGTWMDGLIAVVSVSGVSIPILLLGPVLLFVFFLELGWLPGPTETSFAAVILPAIGAGSHMMAKLTRMTRSSVLEVLGDDFVRTARGKGLAEPQVIGKHALRNALLPVITVVGMQFGSVLSGAIIIETVFARPGVGHLLKDAISERNYPVVQGCVFVIALIYVFVNIATDIAYGLVDPRIRVQ
jgi:ABC-type dipeptide/oligopeptide/nickel transport system permease component